MFSSDVMMAMIMGLPRVDVPIGSSRSLGDSWSSFSK